MGNNIQKVLCGAVAVVMGAGVLIVGLPVLLTLWFLAWLNGEND